MSNGQPNAQLKALRADIDRIDSSIIELLGQRFALTRQIGVVKRDAGLGPVDPSREQQMYDRIRTKAEAVDVDPDVAEHLYRTLIASVVIEHRAIAAQKDHPPSG